jgi:hypothetical protein
MQVPTRAWTEGGGGFASGSFPRWSDDVAIEANAMANALANELADCLPDTHSIINYTIYTQATPEDRPVPRYSNTLGIAGTIAVPGWWEAVQATWNFRDTEFETMKIVLLDMDSDNLFGKLVAVSAVPNLNGVATEISSSSKAWSSRNGQRPATILSVTRTLNEKLRRAYGHTG